MNESKIGFKIILNKKPTLYAKIKGSEKFSDINGNVLFYNTRYGVVVVSEIEGLRKIANNCDSPIFAFHIHSGNACTGDDEDPFKDALTHYNPTDCKHPYHAGDLPPLFSANGRSFSAVLTDRFSIEDIVNKTIVLHNSVDDFTSQPAGNSGEKIACGEIKRFRK